MPALLIGQHFHFVCWVHRATGKEEMEEHESGQTAKAVSLGCVPCGYVTSIQTAISALQVRQALSEGQTQPRLLHFGEILALFAPLWRWNPTVSHVATIS